MPLKADWKYTGTVLGGSGPIESQFTGSVGYEVHLECEDGSAAYTIWLTEKNRKRAAKDFEILGADTTRLGDSSYLEYELAGIIEGKPIKFGTREEEYKEKKRVKVAWIGKPSDGKPAQAAAKFFGGNGAVVGAVNDEIDDSDIPF